MTKKPNPLSGQSIVYMKEEIDRQRRGIAIYKKSISLANGNIKILEREIERRKKQKPGRKK